MIYDEEKQQTKLEEFMKRSNNFLSMIPLNL